jgi:hypothetical protein
LIFSIVCSVEVRAFFIDRLFVATLKKGAGYYMMQAKSQAAEIDRRNKMADEDKKKSFWETLPGVITAVGGLLVGVAAVIAALNEGATKENTPKAEPLAVVHAPPPELERQLAEIASDRAC